MMLKRSAQGKKSLIINVGSVAEFILPEDYGFFTASKCFQSTFSRVLAKSL